MNQQLREIDHGSNNRDLPPTFMVGNVEYDHNQASLSNKSPTTYAYPVGITPTVITEVQPLSTRPGDSPQVYAMPQQPGIQYVSIVAVQPNQNGQRAAMIGVLDPDLLEQQRRRRAVGGFTIAVIIMILIYVTYSS